MLFLRPLPPAMALAASRSPVWSFKVLAKPLTEQSSLPPRERRNDSDTVYDANTWNLVT